MLLVDTQMVLWLAEGSERISPRALQAMSEASSTGGGLAIASVTLLEIAMLEAKGKISLKPSVESFLEKVETGYRVIPLDRRIAVRAMQFSANYPNDPADRQIGATAVIHDLSLVTSDTKIRLSGEVNCIS